MSQGPADLQPVALTAELCTLRRCTPKQSKLGKCGRCSPRCHCQMVGRARGGIFATPTEHLQRGSSVAQTTRLALPFAGCHEIRKGGRELDSPGMDHRITTRPPRMLQCANIVRAGWKTVLQMGWGAAVRVRMSAGAWPWVLAPNADEEPSLPCSPERN